MPPLLQPPASCPLPSVSPPLTPPPYKSEHPDTGSSSAPSAQLRADPAHRPLFTLPPPARHCSATHLAMLLSASVLVLAAQAAARTSVHIQACEGEHPALHCYNGAGDVPQKVNVDDVAHVAQALRDYGRETHPGRFLTMTAANAPDCAEWVLYKHQSVLALAKHIDSKADSSVLFQDIANSIDGGESASRDDRHQAIISCASSGGARGVWVNVTNPAYYSGEYKHAGYTPDGILIKIVSNTDHFDL